MSSSLYVPGETHSAGVSSDRGFYLVRHVLELTPEATERFNLLKTALAALLGGEHKRATKKDLGATVMTDVQARACARATGLSYAEWEQQIRDALPPSAQGPQKATVEHAW